jgi:hypothetical protein
MLLLLLPIKARFPQRRLGDWTTKRRGGSQSNLTTPTAASEFDGDAICVDAKEGWREVTLKLHSDSNISLATHF